MKGPGLLLATGNKGKLQELRQLLADLPLELYDLGAFAGVQLVPETGNTFIENASLKASGYARQANLLTLADDSGLEVDALSGAPGVLSARYAAMGSSDADRAHKLLAELSNVPVAARTARFVSAIAIADSDGRVINLSTGTCEGLIANAPRGSNGFGYDPVFIPDGFNQTLAELQSDVKNRISHRARALVDAREFLRALTAPSDAR